MGCARGDDPQERPAKKIAIDPVHRQPQGEEVPSSNKQSFDRMPKDRGATPDVDVFSLTSMLASKLSFEPSSNGESEKGFASLPAELQEIIFDNVFTASSENEHRHLRDMVANNKESGQVRYLPNAIQLLASKKVYLAGVRSFWQSTTFVSDSREDDIAFVKLPDEIKSLLSSLVLNTKWATIPGKGETIARRVLEQCPKLKILKLDIKIKDYPVQITGSLLGWEDGIFSKRFSSELSHLILCNVDLDDAETLEAVLQELPKLRSFRFEGLTKRSLKKQWVAASGKSWSRYKEIIELEKSPWFGPMASHPKLRSVEIVPDESVTKHYLRLASKMQGYADFVLAEKNGKRKIEVRVGCRWERVLVVDDGTTKETSDGGYF